MTQGSYHGGVAQSTSTSSSSSSLFPPPHSNQEDLHDVPQPAAATATESTPLLRTRHRVSSTSNAADISSIKYSSSSRICNWKICLLVGALILSALVAIIVTLAITGSASSIVISLLSSLSSLSACSTCFTLLVPLRQLALLGDSVFVNTFTSLCTDLHIQPADVCRGALERQGPAIAQSLRQIQPNKRTAASLCTKVFGLCSSRGEHIPDWPSEMFPLASNISHKPNTIPSGKRRKIVQISDIHIDRLYKTGAEANCGRVLCCRGDDSRPNTLASSSNNGNSDEYKLHSPAGPFGNPNCDAPYSLFKSMLEGIKEHASDADFIVSTGDIASHAVWEESQQSTSLDILEAFAIMRSALNMPVYGTLGNHDIAPVNLFPLSSNPRAFQASQWTYETHYTAWREWIGSQVNRSSFYDNVGSYAIERQDMRLRVISINTNYWSVDNFYAYSSETPPADPQGLLAFLIRELHIAETKGQHALVIGHASPSTAFPAQSHYFDQIIQRYRSTVIAQLYGHTHSSDFSVSYSTPAQKTAETASSVSLVSGALTPFGRTVNPGFRVYELDEATGEIWDWKEYYANITDPSFQEGPRWEVLYSARNIYGPMVSLSEDQPLRPSFWHNLSLALEDSLPAFRRFIYNKYRGSKFASTKACRSDLCRRYVLCGLRRSRSEDKCERISAPSVIDDGDKDGNDNKLEKHPKDEGSQVNDPSTDDVRDELEEYPRDFGMEELLRGIVSRAKNKESPIDTRGLHQSVMSKL